MREWGGAWCNLIDLLLELWVLRRVHLLEFGVQGSRFRVWGLAFRVDGVEFWV